jgi:Leucine-rich repeat (LRR) protein
LVSIDLSDCLNLASLDLYRNQLTNIGFLATLPNPKKLETLGLSANDIQPTTLDFLRPFVNLKTVTLGVTKTG